MPHLKDSPTTATAGSPRALARLTERSQISCADRDAELWFGRAGPDVLFEDLEAARRRFKNRVIGGLVVDARKGNFTLKKDVRFNGAVFRAVRPGAVRIGTTSTRDALKALAFKRPQGGIVTALRATDATNMVVRGLPAGDYAVSDGDGNPQIRARRGGAAANGDLRIDGRRACRGRHEPR